VHGNTAFLDGSLFSVPLGKDISSATINHPQVFGSVVPKEAETVANGNIMALSSMPSISTHPSTQSVDVFHATSGVSLSSHTLAHPSFHRRHILSVKQFTHRDMYDLFSLAHEMRLQVERNGTLDILKGRVLCTLFYEPSTRTSSSFDAAMKRCGGEVVQISADTSSVAKGESLPDTIRTLGCYGDAIVIRHPDVGSAQLAAKFSPVPIINAGDGIGEHPTQVITHYHCIASIDTYLVSDT
jgi:carbamoyl-phosphate synthase/aspartate carbamoyltransferase